MKTCCYLGQKLLPSRDLHPGDLARGASQLAACRFCLAAQLKFRNPAQLAWGLPKWMLKRASPMVLHTRRWVPPVIL